MMKADKNYKCAKCGQVIEEDKLCYFVDKMVYHRRCYNES